MIRFFWRFKTQKNTRWKYKDFDWHYEVDNHRKELHTYYAQEFIDPHCKDSKINPIYTTPNKVKLRNLLTTQNNRPWLRGIP